MNIPDHLSDNPADLASLKLIVSFCSLLFRLHVHHVQHCPLHFPDLFIAVPFVFHRENHVPKSRLIGHFLFIPFVLVKSKIG